MRKDPEVSVTELIRKPQFEIKLQQGLDCERKINLPGTGNSKCVLYARRCEIHMPEDLHGIDHDS